MMTFMRRVLNDFRDEFVTHVLYSMELSSEFEMFKGLAICHLRRYDFQHTFHYYLKFICQVLWKGMMEN